MALAALHRQPFNSRLRLRTFHGAWMSSENADVCEVLSMWTAEEIEREHYEQRQKAIRDRISELEEMAEKLANAKSESVEKGVAKGLLMGEIRAFQLVLKQPLSPEGELQPLSLDELKR